MHVIRVTTDLTVPDIEEARAFYADYLGLNGEDMGLDWVTRFVVPSSGEHIQLVSRDATAPENSLLTVRSMTSTTPMRRPVDAVTRLFVH